MPFTMQMVTWPRTTPASERSMRRTSAAASSAHSGGTSERK